MVPRVREARIIGTTVGARPTIYKYGPTEDALSREHEIVDHAKDGAPGLYSLLGGKLASYRLFAQEATDVIAPALGVNAARGRMRDDRGYCVQTAKLPR
mgnify:CR=1 FL=1